MGSEMCIRDRYNPPKYFKYRQYSRVSNPKLLQVPGVTTVSNPQIVRVWKYPKVQRPEIFLVLVVLATPKYLEYSFSRSPRY